MRACLTSFILRTKIENSSKKSWFDATRESFANNYIRFFFIRRFSDYYKLDDFISQNSDLKSISDVYVKYQDDFVEVNNFRVSSTQ